MSTTKNKEKDEFRFLQLSTESVSAFDQYRHLLDSAILIVDESIEFILQHNVGLHELISIYNIAAIFSIHDDVLVEEKQLELTLEHWKQLCNLKPTNPFSDTIKPKASVECSNNSINSPEVKSTHTSAINGFESLDSGNEGENGWEDFDVPEEIPASPKIVAPGLANSNEDGWDDFDIDDESNPRTEPQVINPNGKQSSINEEVIRTSSHQQTTEASISDEHNPFPASRVVFILQSYISASILPRIIDICATCHKFTTAFTIYTSFPNTFYSTVSNSKAAPTSHSSYHGLERLIFDGITSKLSNFALSNHLTSPLSVDVYLSPFTTYAVLSPSLFLIPSGENFQSSFLARMEEEQHQLLPTIPSIPSSFQTLTKMSRLVNVDKINERLGIRESKAIPPSPSSSVSNSEKQKAPPQVSDATLEDYFASSVANMLLQLNITPKMFAVGRKSLNVARRTLEFLPKLKASRTEEPAAQSSFNASVVIVDRILDISSICLHSSHVLDIASQISISQRLDPNISPKIDGMNGDQGYNSFHSQISRKVINQLFYPSNKNALLLSTSAISDTANDLTQVMKKILLSILVKENLLHGKKQLSTNVNRAEIMEHLNRLKLNPASSIRHAGFIEQCQFILNSLQYIFSDLAKDGTSEEIARWETLRSIERFIAQSIQSSLSSEDRSASSANGIILQLIDFLELQIKPVRNELSESNGKDTGGSPTANTASNLPPQFTLSISLWELLSLILYTYSLIGSHDISEEVEDKLKALLLRIFINVDSEEVADLLKVHGPTEQSSLQSLQSISATNRQMKSSELVKQIMNRLKKVQFARSIFSSPSLINLLVSESAHNNSSLPRKQNASRTQASSAEDHSPLVESFLTRLVKVCLDNHEFSSDIDFVRDEAMSNSATPSETKPSAPKPTSAPSTLLSFGSSMLSSLSSLSQLSSSSTISSTPRVSDNQTIIILCTDGLCWQEIREAFHSASQYPYHQVLIGTPQIFSPITVAHELFMSWKPPLSTS